MPARRGRLGKRPEGHSAGAHARRLPTSPCPGRSLWGNSTLQLPSVILCTPLPPQSPRPPTQPPEARAPRTSSRRRAKGRSVMSKPRTGQSPAPRSPLHARSCPGTPGGCPPGKGASVSGVSDRPRGSALCRPAPPPRLGLPLVAEPRPVRSWPRVPARPGLACRGHLCAVTSGLAPRCSVGTPGGDGGAPARLAGSSCLCPRPPQPRTR